MEAVRNCLGRPSGLFLFASPGLPGPGGRWYCGGAEEQQVVLAGVPAVHKLQGTGRAEWGSSLGWKWGWGGTAHSLLPGSFALNGWLVTAQF